MIKSISVAQSSNFRTPHKNRETVLEWQTKPDQYTSQSLALCREPKHNGITEQLTELAGVA